MRTFQASNINCENCANTIKVSLEDEFGDILVDVAKKQVSLNVDDEEVQNFKEEMSELGFDIISEVK